MSADQDWSEAIKASIENVENFAHCATNRTERDIQADFLPTSSQSPRNSPQDSPDSQQTHLSHAQQHRESFCSNSQDQHISQSCVPPPNMSRNSEPAASSEKISIFVPESQQQHCPAAQRISPKMASPKQNESNSNANYNTSKAQAHPHGSPQRNPPQNQGGPVINSQADKTVVPSFSNRQPPNVTSDHHPVHHPTSQQPNQQRPPLNVSNPPRHQQMTRMVSSPRQMNSQQVRQSIPRQIPPHQPFIGVRQPHHLQQRMPHQLQQQRPLHPGSSGAANIYPNKKVATPNFTAPSLRPPMAQPDHPQSAFPSHAQGTRPVNQNQSQQMPMSMPRQGLQPPAVRRTDGSLNVNRMSQPQDHQTFPNPLPQRVAQHKQDGESDEGMQQGPGMHPHVFEDEEMYYDEEDDDGEDMDDMDEDEIGYSGFQGNLGYGYPSSDSDELSEEESALLEELRCCEDDIRYEEIVGRLREKGVDPEEIEEMLYHSNYPEEMYPGENYDDDDEDDDGEESEAEGTVSSSSQGQMPHMRNQMRQHVHTFPPGGQNQPRTFPGPPVGQNQKEAPPAPVGMNGQQMAAGALNHPVMSPSTDGMNQRVRASGVHGLHFQPQQKASDTTQSNVQGDVKHPQQQPELKIFGQGNQEKKIPQVGQAEASQSIPQTSGWQPLQNVVRAQSQVRPGDTRHQTPKAVLQPGQSPGPLGPRPSLMNRPPHPPGNNGAARSQGPAQSSTSGIVVRPVQHLTIMASNNQAGAPNQGAQNRPLIVRQTTSVQQLVISSVPPSNPQSGSAAASPQTMPPFVKTAFPRPPSQVQQKPPEQQGVPETLPLPAAQPPGVTKPVAPISQSAQSPQGMINSPRLKAVLDKDTAPSEASLARLKVMHMQQILDQEIKAKKGTSTTPGHLPAQQNPNTSPNLNIQNRLPSPQNLNQFPVGPSGPVFQHPKQQNQTFPAYQPKHQLPPRQPIPAIVNPNSSTNQTIPGSRPICSVVPFTSQNRPPIATNAQRQITPQQIGFVRPRNPAPLSPQLPPGVPVNRIPAPAVTQSSSPPSALPSAPPSSSPSATSTAPLSRSLTQGNTVPPPPSATSTAPLSRSLTQGNTVPPPSTNQAILQPPVTDIVHNQQQQQSQVPIAKSDSFSLDHLSEDKCIITGKGKQQGLTVNMVYQIRSPKDNSLVLALWNGERFEDLKQPVLGQTGQTAVGGAQASLKPVSDTHKPAAAQHGQAVLNSEKDRKDKSILGGSSKFQAESLAQTNEEEEQSYPGSEFHPHTGLNTNTDMEHASDRLMKPAADVSFNQSTYLKPLPQGQHQPKNEAMEEEEEDEFVFKKPFNENEDYFRVCQYCGYTSKNFKRCESCKRVFQGEVKIHSLKKQPTKSSPSGPTAGASNLKLVGSPPHEEPVRKKEVAGPEVNNVPPNAGPVGRGRGRGGRGRSGRTRGGGLRGKMGAKGAPGENFDANDSDSSAVGRRNSDGSGSSSDGSVKRRPARAKSKNPTPRKRKKADEPVTVTISSDEDEPSSTSNNMASHAPSPAHSAGSESPIFPSLPAEPINAFGRFRRVLMEDEDGQSKLSKKMHQQIMAPHMDRLEDEDEEDEDEDDEGNEPPTYEIDIRSVRIGSMRTQPEGPLLINMQGVCFKVRSERTEEAFEFEILAQDVEQVKFFSGQTQPVLFLFLSPECGEILRRNCHMEPGDDEYFDPSSTDMKQKMVVIIIECFNYMPHEMLRETLSLWADVNHVEDECFIEELTEESANDLLIQSAPPVLTADVERDVVKFKRRYLRDTNMPSLPRLPGSPSDSTDNEPDSTSSSPPEIKNHFGSSIRLLQYPPPPARGIPITTEDLFCLTEGEFLNDVIIDFYLQYLYQEKLTEENRRRTHIFSSFFYKRLTQRDRHSEKTEEDAKKSLPERRHARVKKWTKTVDLFSKDFIIVPINEHSHWYLAVICFPGLANSEVVPFIPSVAHKGDLDEESTDNAGEEKSCEENGSQDSVPKTILGQQLNAKQCLDNEDSKYNLGQKQPCILMFDSLAGPSRTPNVRMLREYVQCEWNAKKSEPRNIYKILRGSTPKVPQQSNYSDCGVYLLQYVESFFEDPIADFQIPMKGLQNWFPEDLVHNKRMDIHDLIMSLHRRYQEERGDPRILTIKFESTPRESQMKFHPNAEMGSRPEEGMFPGYSRDDESSNSSISGEMYRQEMASGAMAMEHSSSFRDHGQLGNQHGSDRHRDEEEEEEGSEDAECNENIGDRQSQSFCAT